MINPSNIRFPTINKTFLKGMFWLMFFIFLATKFTFVRGIYDTFLPKADVKKNVIPIGEDINLKNEIWIQRAIIIHNRGNDDAKDLYIQCMIPSGRFSRYKIVSEEIYSASSTDEQSSSFSLKLKRLSAGSKIILLIWASVSNARQPLENETPAPVISASFKGGIAVTNDKPTALEKVEKIGNFLICGLGAITQRVKKKFEVDSFTQLLIEKIMPLIEKISNRFFILRIEDDIIESQFKNALLTTFFIAWIVWLLFERNFAVAIILLLSGGFIWLFFRIEVTEELIMLLTIIFFGSCWIPGS